MKKEFVLDKILPVLLILAVFFLFTNIILLQSRSAKWNEAQEIVKEKLRPAELQVVKLTIDSCSLCIDVDDAIIRLASLNVNITKERSISSTSSEGKEFIAKYEIKKLPSFIVNGEINKSEQLTNYFSSNGEIKQNSFIYTLGKAPYYDVSKQETAGIVSVFTVIDLHCPGCTDLSEVLRALKEQGVYLQENKEIDYQSAEGRKLVEKYGINAIPALLISKDIDAYPEMQKQLLEAGASEKDEFYALHAIVPPYRDVATDSIIGLVDLVMLSDKSCSECYDVIVNKQILQRFGLAFKSENSYDINSQQGKELKEKYTIENVPIFILSPDASLYSALVQVWKSVGSVEKDGWFVMRNPGLIGTYKDLENNVVVNPQQKK